MTFEHLKFGQRLTLGYGFVIVLLIAMSLVGVVMLGVLSDTAEDALKDKYPKTLLVHGVIDDLGVIARAMRNALIMTEPDELNEQLEDIRSSKIRMAARLDKLNKTITEPEGQEILKQIEIVRSAYIFNQEEFLELVAQHRMGEAKNLLLVDLHPYQNDFFALLEKLNHHQGRLMDEASRKAGNAYRTTRNVMLVLCIFAAALGIGITYAFTRSLLRQLGGEPDYARDVARRIASGELSATIDIGEKDRSSLLFAMKAMRDSLIERTNALQDANEELEASLRTLHQAQDDLIRSEKLAALGSLVAGIAHELNTPIGNSMMTASTLVDYTRDFARNSANGIKRSTFEQYVRDVTEAGNIMMRNLERAGDLVASFKRVAVDRESSQRRQFDLGEVVSQIVLTLWPTLKKTSHKVEQDVPAGLVMNSYPGPLGQELTNLIQNALLHGFDGRTNGTIRISARAAANGCIALSVSDDGIGIPAEHIRRIYDPFFTTKLGAGGSGLGLNITHNIVTGLLCGKINVESEVGSGTTFTMILPVEAVATV